MNRVWWATIFGLLLGALFLAMMQRGCDAGANIDNERISTNDPFLNSDDPAPGVEAPRNLAPITLDAATPNLGRGKRQQKPAEIETATPNPSFGGEQLERGKTRSELQEENRLRAEERERRLAEIRQKREEQNARSRELSRELAISQDRITEAQAERLREIRLNSPSTAEAQRRFREQLTRRGARSASGGAGGGGADGGESAAGGDDGGDSGSDSGLSDEISDALDDLGLDIPSDALDALRDLGGIPPSNGPQNSPTYGDERTDSIGSGGGALFDDIIPVARWESIDTGRAADGRDVSSADLFLGFATRPTVPVISSREEDGLMAPGGGFFTGFVIVPETVDSAEPMLLRSTKLDTFVTVGGAAPFFTPGSESDPAMWGELIVAEWATTDFNGFRVLEPDPDRFGDERYYLWVGRFTAPAGVEEVSGVLGVTWLDLASFSSLQADVVVENDPSLWLDAPEEPDPVDPTEPENPEDPDDSLDPDAPDGVDPGLVIDGASISPTRLLAGQEGVVTVRLRGPAPAGGATIDLGVSDAAALTLPAQLVIPEGEAQGQFTITALEVGATASVQVTLALEGRTISRAVTIALPGVDVDRFTLLPQQTLGGLTVRGTVRLVSPAGDDGALVEITSSSSAATPPATVLVPAGATTVRFDIPTSVVGADVTAIITASSGAASRSAELVIKSEVFGDVNRDGVVDSFDLAALLIELGSGDDDADLNDDGVVDYRDLNLLVDLLESSGGTGAQPGSDLPVVARWVPVPITCSGDEHGGDLTGFRTADLYLGYRDLPNIIGVTSDPVTGIRIEGGGEFYQHPFGNNFPPAANIEEFLPCAVFDSYLTLGETRPLFTPTYGPPAWGPTVGSEWFPSPGQTMEAVVDPALFGDDRSYVRIGRFTAPAGSRFVGGLLELVGVRGTSSFNNDVTAYHCSSCWGEFDLNSDGVVSDLDLEIMIDLLGEPHDMADLDGDGLVDIDDLRLLIAAIGS